MSTLLYSALTTRREEATPGTSSNASAIDAENPKAGKPGVTMWLDAAAALVPAEMLAAHAFLISRVTESRNAPSGDPVTVITDVGNAQILFWVLLAASLVVYVIGHAGNWGGWDFVRMFIPPAAFTIWMVLQPGTAFDAVADPDDFIRYLVGVVGAILLGAIARRLAYKADQETAQET